MAKIVISLLVISVLFLTVLLVLIIGLSIALFFFSRKDAAMQVSLKEKEIR